VKKAKLALSEALLGGGGATAPASRSKARNGG
jgi:hypothetical protein